MPLLTRLGPGPGPLPAVGELYQVDTLLFWGGDTKRSRPAVVVDVPRTAFGRIGLVTRPRRP